MIVKHADHSRQQDAAPAQPGQSWRHGLVGLVVLALLGLGYWVIGGLTTQSRSNGVVAAQSGGLPAPQSIAVVEKILVMHPASAPKPGDKSKSFEVCGLGSFSADDDEVSIRKANASAIEQAKAANIQSLTTSADPATRAAGLVMHMADIAQRGALAGNSLFEACDAKKKESGGKVADAPCADAEAQMLALREKQSVELAPLVEKLAAIAATTKAPAVMAQAVRACTGRTNLQACSLVSAERWARLEPGNLVPWLIILNNARTRQDFAAVNEALYQMSVSKMASGYEFFAWSKFAVDSLQAGSNLERLVSTEQMHSLHFLPGTDFGGLYSECKKPLVADANRRQLCEKIAAVIVEQSDTYLGAGLGAGIGRLAGWPNDKIAAIRAEIMATQQVYGEFTYEFFPESGAQKLDCQSIARIRSVMGAFGQWGEVAAVRKIAKAKGIDIAARAKALLPAELQRLEQESLRAQQRP